MFCPASNNLDKNHKKANSYKQAYLVLKILMSARTIWVWFYVHLFPGIPCGTYHNAY